MASSRPPFILIGNPANRRVTAFAAALGAEGQPPPCVLSHRELIAEPDRLLDRPDTPHLVRLDATGEDPEVERALLALGHDEHAPGVTFDPAARPPRHGEIVAPRQHHRGLLRYLDALDRRLAERPSWRQLNPVSGVRLAFDKVEAWRRLDAAGLPVAPALMPPPEAPDALRARMEASGLERVFVKLASGSSASCLAAYHRGRGPEADYLISSVEVTEDGWFNSLRLRRVQGRRKADAVLAFILGEGAHVEAALPKAKTEEGRYFDLRVLVIEAEARFTVVRTSKHPITNLHLGGARGDLDALRRRVAPEAWAAAMSSCERAFAVERYFHLGVDLLIAPDLERHTLLEINAFGDLLPGLEHAGRDVYRHQISRALDLP